VILLARWRWRRASRGLEAFHLSPRRRACHCAPHTSIGVRACHPLPISHFCRAVRTTRCRRYLFCPIIAVLAAAVAALAAQESSVLSSRSIGLGARRFSSSDDVGRTWLSATEQIESASKRSQQKWVDFTFGVLPAPLLAVLFPGSLSTRAVVAAAVAAAQTAYSLAKAEYSLAAAVESVAIKSRNAAVSDTYANQGARAGAILPFTSALSGLCAAVTVAVVEVLPLIGNVFGESLVCVAFPGTGALIAAAASISKARCEVDAAAASAAANNLAKSDVNVDEFNPVRNTQELVLLLLRNLRREWKGLANDVRSKPRIVVKRFWDFLRRLFGLPPSSGSLASA